MLRLGLNTLRRTFCASKNKNNHQFTELELKQMIQEPNELRQVMLEQIRYKGELKIPQYWKQALTDSKLGYYIHQNVFSTQGDFITSPEISSLFGEMVATWMVVFMQTPSINLIDPMTNSIKKRFRIVELGGGRGLLMRDIIRSFRSYKIDNNFDLCFIQVSEYNRKEQQTSVMNQFKKGKTFFRFDFENATPQKEEFLPQNQQKNVNLKWFSKLQQLLKQDIEAKKQGKQLPFTIFVMNEFFDALPVTILEYTQNGWREKVLSVANNSDMTFNLITSSHELHEKLVPRATQAEFGERIEVSPDSYIAMDMMAKMIKITGGGILNIDYGGNGPYSDSIRAIKKHKYIPAPYFWQVPGTCDLSAYVSFSALAQYAQRVEGVKAFELVPQQFFLQAMGIYTRLENLCKNQPKEKVQRLESEVKRLTSPEEMGELYKVQIITLKQYGEIYPHITVQDNVY